MAGLVQGGVLKRKGVESDSHTASQEDGRTWGEKQQDREQTSPSQGGTFGPAAALSPRTQHPLPLLFSQMLLLKHNQTIPEKVLPLVFPLLIFQH